MPYTWLGFSTVDPRQRQVSVQLRDDVAELWRSELSGGTLLELYFDVGKEVAYALIKDLGDSVTRSA